jgi:hypothetical protein
VVTDEEVSLMAACKSEKDWKDLTLKLSKEKLYTLCYILHLFHEVLISPPLSSKNTYLYFLKRIPDSVGDMKTLLGKLTTLISSKRSELKAPFVISPPSVALPEEKNSFSNPLYDFLHYVYDFFKPVEVEGISLCCYSSSSQGVVISDAKYQEPQPVSHIINQLISNNSIDMFAPWIAELEGNMAQRTKVEHTTPTREAPMVEAIQTSKAPGLVKSHSLDTVALEEILKETEQGE